MRKPLLVTALLALFAVRAQAGIKVKLEGVDADVALNVQTFLSVERYRTRDDIDIDTITRLFNRIDGEVKSALRPFGYYEPVVKSEFMPDGRNWLISVNITPGSPVRVRQISIIINGPGTADPAFDAIRSQTELRIGMRLNHGTYESVKGNLTRTAAANGYLAARLLRNELLVDPGARTAQIALHLDTGPRYNFGAISIEQSVIRPDLMRRFLRFKDGDPYLVTQLLRTQFALDDSLYFSAVDVTPGEPDAQSLTVPIRITAAKSRPVFTIGPGYGTDTSFRGTLGWTDNRVNDRGHRLRFELKASTIARKFDARYDIPIGDPAVERFSLEALHRFEPFSDLDTNETTIRPSVTALRGRWQIITSVAATRTLTDDGQSSFYSNLLVPGIALASVPEGFLGEALFSRAFYIELLGSHSTLGSDADFLRLLVQSERSFNLSQRWHLLLRGEMGTSLVSSFSEVPGIYRFFAGGDRSVRGFGYNTLSPRKLVTDSDGNTELRKIGGRHLLVGSVEMVRDLPRNLAIATFFDIGNAFNHFSDPLEYSVGVGMRYRLPIVSMGLDVAQSLSSSNNLRLHLNISTKL